MAGELDTALGAEEITVAHVNKKKRTQVSPTMDYLREKGLRTSNMSLDPKDISEVMDTPPISIPGPVKPEAETKPGVKPAQKLAAQVATQVTKTEKPGEAGRGAVADTSLQAVGGVRDAAQEMIDGMNSMAVWMAENHMATGGFVSAADAALRGEPKDLAAGQAVRDIGTLMVLPEVDQPDTIVGGLTRGVVQFTAGFLPALKVMKAAKIAGRLKLLGAAPKAAKAGEAVAASMLADFAVFDAHAERLSNFLKQFPILNNPVTRFLAASPNDTELEGRFKNVLEGVGLDVATAGVFVASLKTLRSVKALKNAEIRTSLLDEVRIEEPVKIDAAQILKDQPAKDIFGEKRGPLVSRIKKQLPKVSQEDAEAFLNLTVESKSGNALNINLAKVETEADVQKILKKAAEFFSEDIDKATRGTQSNARTAKLAEDLGLTVAELLNRRKGKAFNAEEALAARQLLISSAENLKRLAAKVQTIDVSDADRVLFRRAVSMHAAIQQQVSGLTAEAGRALQAFQIKAKSQKEQLLAVQNILEASGKRGTSDDLAQAILDATDLTQVHKIAKKAHQADTSDMVFEVWINALLSGPRTHLVNITSNAINALIQLPERLTASLIGKILRTEGGVPPGEVIAQAFGFLDGVKDGWRMMKEAFRTEGRTDPLTKIQFADRSAITAENASKTFIGSKVVDPILKTLNVQTLADHGIVANFVDGVGSAVRFPGFRLLNSEDAFFKGLNYRMELHAQAYRQASAEGLTGKPMAERIASLIENPTEHMRVLAKGVANVNTFTNPNKTAGAIARFTRDIPGLRYIIPFVNTPSNIVKFGFERTPFAFMSNSVKADILAGGARRDLALSRIALGATAMAYAWNLASSGDITGGAPQDPALKKTWLAQNQEYSIRFQGEDGTTTFVSYNRLEPMGMLFGIAADYSNIVHTLGEREAAELIGASVLALTKNVTSKTWLRGVSEFIAAYEDSENRLGPFITRLGTGFIPNAINQVNMSLVDPVLRDSRGFQEGDFAARSLAAFVDAAKEKVPGYSKTLPAQRNLWGEPIEPRANFSDTLGQRVYNLLSPAYVKQVEGDRVNEILIDNEIEIRMPRRTIAIPGVVQGGVELTAVQYNRYVELAGKPAKEALDTLVNQSGFDQNPTFVKAQIFQRIVSSFRQVAKAQLIKEFPDLQQRMQEKRDEFQAELRREEI